MAYYVDPDECYDDEYHSSYDKGGYGYGHSSRWRNNSNRSSYEDDFYEEDYSSQDDEYSDEEETEEESESDEEFGSKPRSGGYKPEPSKAEIREIIRSVMEEEDIYYYDIPKEEQPFHPSMATKHSFRYYSTKGFAWFCCPTGHHRWPSAHSWCYLDLRKQRICSYRYQQKCKKCDKSVDPEFSVEAVESMARYAVLQFQIRTGQKKRVPRVPRSFDGDGRMTNNKPHHEDKCAKCQELGRSCWKRS